MALTLQSSQIPSIPNSLIPLGNGKFAIVDPEDFPALNQFTWRLRKSHSTYYVVRKETVFGKRSLVFMHRQIMQPGAGFEVHHKNLNPLDNRRFNLLILSVQAHKRIHNLNRIQQRQAAAADDLFNADP